ncbi:hypothetical protein K456DRAFT_31982 [Colletotrichum gloeosporioides 23]|nr:hypothetical protein K456DRAFT_31982 [Colletotrichum gloeosporioides 23]
MPSGLESKFQITHFPTSKQQYQPSARVLFLRPILGRTSPLNRELNPSFHLTAHKAPEISGRRTPTKGRTGFFVFFVHQLFQTQPPYFTDRARVHVQRPWGAFRLPSALGVVAVRPSIRHPSFQRQRHAWAWWFPFPHLNGTWLPANGPTSTVSNARLANRERRRWDPTYGQTAHLAAGLNFNNQRRSSGNHSESRMDLPWWKPIDGQNFYHIPITAYLSVQLQRAAQRRQDELLRVSCSACHAKQPGFAGSPPPIHGALRARSHAPRRCHSSLTPSSPTCLPA